MSPAMTLVKTKKADELSTAVSQSSRPQRLTIDKHGHDAQAQDGPPPLGGRVDLLRRRRRPADERVQRDLGPFGIDTV